MKTSVSLIALLTFLLVATLTTSCSRSSNAAVKPLPLDTYENLKALIHTKGTTLSTVTIVSSQNHSLKGTLVRNGTTEIIVTAAHTFATRTPDSEYQYVLDGRNYTIQTVYSHPKPGAFGGKDIAFCIPGPSQRIRHFWKADIDTTYLNVMPCLVKEFTVTLLEGFVKMPIKGAISDNDSDQLYVVGNPSKDGDSGSGLVGDGRLFVIRGNIPSSSIDLSKQFGVETRFLTLLTEL